MTFITDLFAKLGTLILTKLLTPKNVKKIFASLLKFWVKNIKNDNKTDWKDTHLVSWIEEGITMLEAK